MFRYEKRGNQWAVMHLNGNVVFVSDDRWNAYITMLRLNMKAINARRLLPNLPKE